MRKGYKAPPMKGMKEMTGISSGSATARPIQDGDLKSKAFIRLLYRLSVAAFILGGPGARAQISNSAASYAERGIAFYARGNLDEAIVDYSAAIAFDPKFAPAYYLRGLSRFDKGDLDGAITDFAAAIEINP